MTEKSKIDEAFEKWEAKEDYLDKKGNFILRNVHFMMYKEKSRAFTAGYKQSRIDLAENIHVALTFAECGLKDKDYALKLAREIIDKELDDDYWENR